MKIVITGTSGLVGFELWEKLKEKNELWGVGRKKPKFISLSNWRTTDIIDAELTCKTIQQINPDCLIHSAAISNPDECEKDPLTAYKANALGTRNIALACQRFDTELVYISSDQIFDGKKKSPYTELDKPAPINHYGVSKLWGEKFVRSLSRRFYIVRTALVYGSVRPTFVDRIVRATNSGESVVAATDIVNSPTYSQDLALAISFLIEKRLYGIYHIVNEGHCSRYELSRFIAESIGKKPNFIKKGTLKNLNLKAPRPGYTPLENFAWNLNEFPKMRSWEEALMSFLEEIPESGS